MADSTKASEHDPEVAAVLLFANRVQVIRWCSFDLPDGEREGVLALNASGNIVCRICGSVFPYASVEYTWAERADILDEHLRKGHLPEVLRSLRARGVRLTLSPPLGPP